MTTLTFTFKNLRALRDVTWTPKGVCAVVGPNGSGKTTLIEAIRALAKSANEPNGIRDVFGDLGAVRTRGVNPEEPVVWAVAGDGAMWQATSVGAAGAWQIFWEHHAPTVDATVASVRPAPAFVANLRAHVDADLHSLRKTGSTLHVTSDVARRGENTFAVLRHWANRREHRERYAFVLDGLRATFPALCDDLDFEEAGNIVTMRVFRPGEELPFPIGHEANGFLSALVTLTEVAACEPGGLVAIDEPETGLHPEAIRVLLEVIQAHAARKDFVVVFTTHSPVLLGCLAAEQVFVLPGDGTLKKLTEVENPQWLSQFSLGDLYAGGEFGAPKKAG